MPPPQTFKKETKKEKKRGIIEKYLRKKEKKS